MNSARCARPACSGTPAAWLAYDYDARCAWLDDEAEDADAAERSRPAHAWPLCERHADNLKVPRGWFCVDRRASRFGPQEDHPGDQDAEAAPPGEDVIAGRVEPEHRGRPSSGSKRGPVTAAEAKRSTRGQRGPRGGGRVTSIL